MVSSVERRRTCERKREISSLFKGKVLEESESIIWE